METLVRPPTEQITPSQADVNDQDPLAKLDFEGVDPHFSDVAYHFTSEENLAGINREGLRPADAIGKAETERTKNWAASDHALMEAKPADMPVDLEHVVFGQLEQRHLGTDNSYALRSSMDRGESIAIAVDPHDTYVGNARIREELVNAASEWGTEWFDGDISKLREYFWENTMPLAVFKDLYEPAHDDEEAYWQLKDPSNEEKLDIAGVVSLPELYIPFDAGEDTIPVDRLAHTASSLVGRQ